MILVTLFCAPVQADLKYGGVPAGMRIGIELIREWEIKP